MISRTLGLGACLLLASDWVAAQELFFDSGQRLGSRYSQDFNLGSYSGVALADFDGDGDLDAVASARDTVTNASTIYLNDGNGYFADTSQRLDGGRANDVAVGDINGDTFPDFVMIRSDFGFTENHVYLNNGAAFFTLAQTFDRRSDTAVELVDLDSDGDLDMVTANATNSVVGQPNLIYINDGSGQFTDSGQQLGTSSSRGLAVGDLDGDGDPDVFFANVGPNEVWLNDGNGVFSSAGLLLGNSRSSDVALSDTDGDGSLDAVIANDGFAQGVTREPNRLWLNNGAAAFTDSGLAMGNYETRSVKVADIDLDGAPDVYFANHIGNTLHDYGDRIWLNRNGSLQDSGDSLFVGSDSTIPWSNDVELANLDADTDLDAFVAGVRGNLVWLGAASPGAQAVRLDSGRSPIDELGSALLVGLEGEPLGVPIQVLGNPAQDVTLGYQLDVEGNLTTGFATATAPGARSVQGNLPTVDVPNGVDAIAGQLRITDSDPSVPLAAPNQAIFAVLSNPTGNGDETLAKINVFADEACFMEVICRIGAVAQPVCDQLPEKSAKGIEGSLNPNQVTRFRDEVLIQSPSGRYYTDRYYRLSPDLARATFRSPTLVFDVIEASRLWMPAINSVLDGDGSEPITPAMGNIYREVFEGLKQRGSASLIAVLDMEDERLTPLSLVGLTAADARVRFESADTDSLFESSFDQDP